MAEFQVPADLNVQMDPVEEVVIPPLNVAWLGARYKESHGNLYGLKAKRLVRATLAKVAEERNRVGEWPTFLSQDNMRRMRWGNEIRDIYFGSNSRNLENPAIAEWFQRYCVVTLHRDWLQLPQREKMGKCVRHVGRLGEIIGRYLGHANRVAISAAILVKCFDSMEFPEGTVLPRMIYETARPAFLDNWEMWSQRLSVPEDLADAFPLAIHGEDVADPPEMCAALQESNRGVYFLHDPLANN